MFPDPTSRWLPYPSIIDGIERPPFVLDRGLWRGVLSLIVVGSHPSRRSYGVQFQCEAYGAFEEAFYSICGHGDAGISYDGGVYIKEAAASALKSAYDATGPFSGLKARHFALVGGDFCYEVLATGEPHIFPFASEDEAYAWAPPQPLERPHPPTLGDDG